MAISDLSRLRERWIRLENQIAKLESQVEEAADYEVGEIIEKIQIVRNRLETTKILVGWEEKRLLNSEAKLNFKPRKIRNSIS